MWSRKQTTKLATETADISTTQENPQGEITNEDNAYHFLLYQEYWSLLIPFTKPNS